MKLTSCTFKSVIKVTLVIATSIGYLLNNATAQTERPTTKENTPVFSDPATQTIQECIALMEQKQWQNALDLINKLITKYQGKGVEAHGAKFGTSYYYRGLCMLKLAQATNNEVASNLYESAIQSFNQCFAINPATDSSNIYRAKSLLLRGNSEQALQRYPSAIESYQKFLTERNTARDVYNLSEFNINLAICMWKNAGKNKTGEVNHEQEIQDVITLIKQSLLHSGKNSPSPQVLITGLNILSQIGASIKDDSIVSSAIQRIEHTTPGNLDITRSAEAINTNEQFNILSKNLTSLSKLILKTSLENQPDTSLELTTIFPEIQKYANALHIDASLITQRVPQEKTYLGSET